MANAPTNARRYDTALSGFLAAAVQPDSVFKARDAVKGISVDPQRFKGILWSDDPRQYSGVAELVTGDGMKRAPSATSSKSGDFDPLQANYECIERAHKKFLSEADENRSLFPMREEQRRMSMMGRLFQLELEYECFSGQIFNTSNWSNAAVGALVGGKQVAWNAATSSPTQDGLAMRQIIRNTRGVYPNVGVITQDVLETLRTHPETLGVYGTVAQGLVNAPSSLPSDDQVIEKWRQIWRLERLIAVEAMYNTNGTGEVLSLSDIESGQVWFGCDQGMANASEVVGGVSIEGGPVSLLRIDEIQPSADEERVKDPRGKWMYGWWSYVFVIPNDMASTAYLLTGVNG